MQIELIYLIDLNTNNYKELLILKKTIIHFLVLLQHHN